MTKRIEVLIEVVSVNGFGPWSPDKNIYHCVDVGEWKSESTNQIWKDDHLSLPECYDALCNRYQALIGTSWRAVDVRDESRYSDSVVFEQITV